MTLQRMSLISLILLATPISTGCRHLLTSDSRGQNAVNSGSSEHAPARVRRLTASELDHTARDVFQLGATTKLDLMADTPLKEAFDNQIDSLDVSQPVVDSLQATAEIISRAAVSQLPKLLDCDAKAQSESACVDRFLSTIGRRAYRRSLTADEKAAYMQLFATVRPQDSYEAAIAALIEALVQSPNFLYRSELGGAPGADGLVRLTPLETASALAYFIWRSAPDLALLDAAEGGQLTTPEQIAAQTTRLINDDRAHTGVWEFYAQYLQLQSSPGGLSAARVQQYPVFTPAVAQQALSETQAFTIANTMAPQGGYTQLWTSHQTQIGPELGRIYAVNAPAAQALVTLDAGSRGGLFTQSSFLASLSGGVGFSPVHLGKFVAAKVFCNDIPPPPPNTPTVVPAAAGKSPRQRFAAHSQSPSCSGCHARFEPMGWGFEQYDAVGTFSNTAATH